MEKKSLKPEQEPSKEKRGSVFGDQAQAKVYNSKPTLVDHKHEVHNEATLLVNKHTKNPEVVNKTTVVSKPIYVQHQIQVHEPVFHKEQVFHKTEVYDQKPHPQIMPQETVQFPPCYTSHSTVLGAINGAMYQNAPGNAYDLALAPGFPSAIPCGEENGLYYPQQGHNLYYRNLYTPLASESVPLVDKKKSSKRKISSRNAGLKQETRNVIRPLLNIDQPFFTYDGVPGDHLKSEQAFFPIRPEYQTLISPSFQIFQKPLILPEFQILGAQEFY